MLVSESCIMPTLALMMYHEAKRYLEEHLSRIDVNVKHILDDLENYDQARLDAVVEDVLCGRPVQYVTHTSHFYGRRYFVDNRVLIPRPETEELVREVISKAKQMPPNITVIDVGTGSGVIPISLAYDLPRASIYAIDYSEQALEVARINAIRHNKNIEFIQTDFLDTVRHKELPICDALVSNPPYIPNREKSLMGTSVVEHEPHMALFVSDESPLVFYEALAIFGRSHLSEDGYILCEINEFLGKETADLFDAHGYSDVSIIQDMQGKERICVCKR